MKKSLYMVICWLLFFSAGPTWAGNLLGIGDTEIISPPSGVTLEEKKSPDGNLTAYVANCKTGPLPGENSIIAGFTWPKTDTIISFPLENYFWTEPKWVGSLGEVRPDTEFLLWQEGRDRWAAIIPLAGGGMRSMLSGGGRGSWTLLITSESFDSHFSPTRVPMFAVGFGPDPYTLIPDLYAFAFSVMREVDPEHITGRLRVEKPYPELFRYLGWCSWNAHYRWVTQDDLFEHGRSFKAAGFPIGWMLIDDGWQTMQEEMYNRWSKKKMFMTSFEANRKFPGGLAATTAKLKGEYGVRGVGVWHTFQGYWDGFAIDSDLGRQYQDALLPYSAEAAIPDPRSDAGARLWEDWYKLLAEWGIDFTKVDNQSRMAQFTRDVLPVGHAMSQGQRNIQAASAKYLNLALIDCMEMRTDVLYYWGQSNIGRTSNDYVPAFTNNPRSHVMKNVMNSLWFSNLLYPDYDMFQSHNLHATYHLVARAISGGPVYTTDKAGEEKWELLYPLILSDGRLIQPDAPGLPARQTLLRDPRSSHRPFTAFARAGAGGALALWNLDRLRLPVRGEIGPVDVEGLSGERFAVYDFFHGQLRIMGREEKTRVWLWGWETLIYSVTPVVEGFAPVGLTNKYFSAATIAESTREGNRAIVKLRDGGPFLAYCETRPTSIRVNGEPAEGGRVRFAAPELRIDLPVTRGTAKEVMIEIAW